LAPAYEAHREVAAPLRVDAEVVHRHDAGVVELAGDLRLLEEAPEALGVDRRRARAVLDPGRARAAPVHDLHGEVAAQVAVPHAQDRAHPAGRDLFLDLVARADLDRRAQAAHEVLDAGRGARALVARLGGLLLLVLEVDARVDLGREVALEALHERDVRLVLALAG